MEDLDRIGVTAPPDREAARLLELLNNRFDDPREDPEGIDLRANVDLETLDRVCLWKDAQRGQVRLGDQPEHEAARILAGLLKGFQGCRHRVDGSIDIALRATPDVFERLCAWNAERENDEPDGTEFELGNDVDREDDFRWAEKLGTASLPEVILEGAGPA